MGRAPNKGNEESGVIKDNVQVQTSPNNKDATISKENQTKLGKETEAGNQGVGNWSDSCPGLL